MRTGYKRKIARAVAAAIALGVLVLCAAFFHASMKPMKELPPGSVSLNGEWEFHNGALSGEPARSRFPERVIVPEPLPETIRDRLATEFWYRRTFRLEPGMADELSLFLGSIKGAHEVYWNGSFLGAGGKVGLALYRIPGSLLQQRDVMIAVKVSRSETLFPGIVHQNPVAVGPSESLQRHLTHYFFETGMRPLVPGIFKAALFFLFIGLFIALPYRREYLWFAFFSLMSAAATSMHSRFLPLYEDYYLKNSLIFLFTIFALACIPPLSAGMLRLSGKRRSWARMHGMSLATVFIGAALLAKGNAALLAVFKISREWAPVAAFAPWILVGSAQAFALDKFLTHRRVQLFSFLAFSTLGLLVWSAGSSKLFQFQNYLYPEFWDLGIFAGLGLSLSIDFSALATRSDRAAKTVPKWFSGFLSSKQDQVVLELPLAVMAIDTVGYTKKLFSLDAKGKAELHERMRSLLGALVTDFQAQKISERGDGGLFAWDFPDSAEERRKCFDLVRRAAAYLNDLGRSEGISFRVGLACGPVRAEMRGEEFSFLGEPLNRAARLESIADPGTVLVDESLVSCLALEGISEEWTGIQIKGVPYRAKTLKVA